ncbi:MAG: hypothetical protein RR909_03615 [Bacilli bacterium]
MFNKNKVFPAFAAILLGVSLCSCSFGENNSISNTQKNIVLTFVQHSFCNNAGEGGYYFKNDQIAVSEFTYKKGFNLNKEEIDNLYKKVDHHVPQLIGDGYWTFTFFTKDFNEETGYSSDFLKEQILDKNMTIHFAIYG